ncbi:transmembrane protein 106A isoform X2 [Maylandia zebra]|uniref:transmembrane protein 106A isoform X2 n=1 Tax=Haplochromis burtoni TaxID=8153 RepID=UPI0003BD2930|nr:transmembrane protein 106A isoform X2 [Haplochromis burtoni]
MVAQQQNKGDPDVTKKMEKVKGMKHFPPYGSMDENTTGDNCPTCRGTGRIPRGQEDQLVAVIPCNDVRLKPRRTKLHVCISMGLCLLICCLILFFLFPRSVTLTPVSVQSVTVYFIPDEVKMDVTNVISVGLDIKDEGIASYCKSSSIKIHTLFLELQMTMNISYLSHTEQLSVETFEYIDCGTNSTIPHPVRI